MIHWFLLFSTSNAIVIVTVVVNMVVSLPKYMHFHYVL